MLVIEVVGHGCFAPVIDAQDNRHRQAAIAAVVADA
jgi:hypothetical protein